MRKERLRQGRLAHVTSSGSPVGLCDIGQAALSLRGKGTDNSAAWPGGRCSWVPVPLPSLCLYFQSPRDSGSTERWAPHLAPAVGALSGATVRVGPTPSPCRGALFLAAWPRGQEHRPACCCSRGPCDADACGSGMEQAWGRMATTASPVALISAPEFWSPKNGQTLIITAPGRASVQPLGSASMCTQSCKNIPTL